MDDKRTDDLLDLVFDAAATLKLDGTILGWNDAAAALFGWSAQEAVGRSIATLVLPPRVAARDHPLARILATGRVPAAVSRATADFRDRNNTTMRLDVAIGQNPRSSGAALIVVARPVPAEGEAEQRQALIIEELNHRMRNLLGVVSSVARQTATASGGLDDFMPAFQGRLASLDHAYRILTTTSDDRGSLVSLVEAVLAARDEVPGCRISVGGPDVQLVRRQFISLNMILHELATNAGKYGALSERGGELDVTWRLERHGKAGESRALQLEWRETMARSILPPMRHGFGTRVIEASARQGLHGSCTTDWLEHGLRFQLRFALL